MAQKQLLLALLFQLALAKQTTICMYLGREKADNGHHDTKNLNSYKTGQQQSLLLILAYSKYLNALIG